MVNHMSKIAISPKTASLIEDLTRADALAYNAETDKLMWIETNLLDPRGINRRQAENVEGFLINLLEIEHKIQSGELHRIDIAMQDICNWFHSGFDSSEFDYVCHAVAFLIAKELDVKDWTKFAGENLTKQFRKQWQEKITDRLEVIESSYTEPTFRNNDYLESWTLFSKYARKPNESHQTFRKNTLRDVCNDFPDLNFEFVVDPKGM